MSLKGFKVGDIVRICPEVQKIVRKLDLTRASDADKYLEKDLEITSIENKAPEQTTNLMVRTEIPFGYSSYIIKFKYDGGASQRWEWVLRLASATQNDLKRYLKENGDSKRASEFIKQLATVQRRELAR